jgi:hypothetical protein
MDATRESSSEHPTIMELQRRQAEALRSGDVTRVDDCQDEIFRRLEAAQVRAAAAVSAAD